MPSNIVVLPSSEIAVGHCVIVNHTDCPSGLMVAVVVQLMGSTVYLKYLDADRRFDGYNKKQGMAIESEFAKHITPISQFGVEVRVNTYDGTYLCVVVGESAAKYWDGKPRAWQERNPVTRTARRDVLAVALVALEQKVGPSMPADCEIFSCVHRGVKYSVTRDGDCISSWGDDGVLVAEMAREIERLRERIKQFEADDQKGGVHDQC